MANKTISLYYGNRILIIQIEVFMYEFFSVRFLTTEAMLPLLPWTARHCFQSVYLMRYVQG
jgi:hypothetical protein